MSRTCPDCQNTYEDEVLHCPEDGLNLSGVPIFDELIGRSIGSYRVIRPLGKGGMGAVYLGEHPVIGSKVAIKFLHPEYATDPKVVDRFFNEARAVNVIGHDNILKIIDLNVTEDNRHYFVMEFLRGRALQSLLKNRAAVGLDVAGPILIQVCEALEAAHRKGIIHRDLKPDNVYLITHKGKKNFVKVVDFGIAKLTDADGASTGKTQTGMVMGTPAYMSPEQGGGATRKIDPRSDVYSLGIMMFQMATGKLPFPGANFGEVLVGHLQQQPPRPRDLVATIPEEYEQIILRCLEKKQEDRYQSMRELEAAIVGCMERLGLSRELPAEDETDAELSPIDPPFVASSPSLRTPSHPGRSTGPGVPMRSSNPGAAMRSSSPGAATRSSSPGAAMRSSSPGARSRGASPHSIAHSPAPEPKSKAPLLAGLAAFALLLAGGAIYGVKLSNERANRAAVRAAAIAASDAAKAASAAREKDAAGTVFLSAVSDPLDSDVRASWKDGEQTATGPLSVEVPKNAKVHFEFKKAGYLAYVTEVLAEQNQQVTAKLIAEPTAAAAERPPRQRPIRKPRADKMEDLPSSKDGLIDLDNALK